MTETKKTVKKKESSAESDVVETPAKELTTADKKDVIVIEKVIENREIAPQDAFGKLSRPQIDLMKRTIARGASDDELKLFIQVCKGANLNPFLKQVFLVPRWDSKEGKEIRAIQVSIDGFRSIAESSGAYAGNEDPIFDGEETIQYGKDKNELKVPKSAKVTVYKIVEGQRYPFSATARWDEYYPGEKMGFQWHSRPYLMLGKCAEALALRKAFPKLLSGMYAQEEMDKSGQMDDSAQKAQKGFLTIKAALEKADRATVEDYKVKIEKSDKYNKTQKAELIEAADKRLYEIDGSEGKA